MEIEVRLWHERGMEDQKLFDHKCTFEVSLVNKNPAVEFSKNPRVWF